MINPCGLSVIVATYNRATALARCLDALARQTCSTNEFEIVVVVDGSTDATRDMLHCGRRPLDLKIIEQPNRGQPAALNAGIRAARGAYCLFLDDDIVLERDCLAEHLRAQRLHGGVIALGRLTCRVPRGADGLAHYVAEWWDERHADLSRTDTEPLATDCIIGNTSVPLDALVAVGAFSTDLPRGFDTDLGARLQDYGLTYRYVPLAVGQQAYAKGHDEVIKDLEKDGSSAWPLYSRHPHLLPHIPLGSYGEGPKRAAALRSCLLMMRIRPSSLRWVAKFIQGTRWEREWYRCVYGLCYWTGVRRTVPSKDVWKRLTHGPVILMYHAFGDASEPASRYVVPARLFRQQLGWIRRCGFHVLSLQEFVCLRASYHLPPRRSVVITIDDGYVDAETLAAPLLNERGITATLFVVTELPGKTAQWTQDVPLRCRPLLDWAALKRMVGDGMEMGAHTRTHVCLPDVADVVAEQEIAGSRTDMERQLGAAPSVFAYPFGEFDEVAQELVYRLGFSAACGVQEGLNSPATPSHALRRVEILGSKGLLHFALGLQFGCPRPLRQVLRGGS